MFKLLKTHLLRLKNSVALSGISKYLLFISFGFLLIFILTYLFIKLFGYIYHEPDFQQFFKLFLSEKILLMVFLMLFLMLIISSLISTLNIFFLSKDLKVLFSTPTTNSSIFFVKTLESIFNSSILVFLFSLPVVFSFCYYFTESNFQIILIVLIYFMFILSGALFGIIVGLIIPVFFSIKKLQPILSILSIIIISSIIVFLRLLKPEQFSNPDIIRNVLNYMTQFDIKSLNIFPFSWISKSFTSISKSEYLTTTFFLFLFFILLIIAFLFLFIFQKKYYFKIYDKLQKGNSNYKNKKWNKSSKINVIFSLWKKEIRTFFRTPEQWSQLLIIIAIVIVFIINMKTIPSPHPSVKNLIAYVNLGILAFIIAGLNSRFTFTSLPMESPGIINLISSPFLRKKIILFKYLFYLIPLIIIGFFLFFIINFLLDVEPFIRLIGFIFLTCTICFETVLAIKLSINIKGLKHLSAQHLIVTKNGILYMFSCIAYIILSLAFLLKPILLYFIAVFKKTEIPVGKISIWLVSYVVINAFLIFFTYYRTIITWNKKEFY